jgi:uncharacterized membrane protein (DUF4010 family)
MLYPRVLTASAVLNSAVVPSLAAYLVAPSLLAAFIAIAGFRAKAPRGALDIAQRNPLQLISALQMALLFQAVLMAVHIARSTWGSSGVLATAAILGLTDVDALTMSMTREGGRTLSPAIAATAIAVGVSANTAMKLGLALSLGSPRFRLIAGGALALMLLALGAALVLAR